ncbi:DMT family transporter [Marinomonas sp. 15G1-11]|uniref:DMT family transporter n=1 Tax=Marinomonas phaeophyticola TaxID=3004091 RepID=A0ABT4JTF3_9GAMM|nr:DMT family transporter [Marinomonas sp. 15G1-11]MCZ2721609.1 DMT family transporter [Marinomonas sp. 15G1-11]
MQNSNHTIGSIELALAMVLSGTIGYFVISSDQSFWNVVFFRCVIGAIALGAYAYYSGIVRKDFFKPSILLMIILGGITLVANWVFLFASFDYIPFSIATVAYHMQPLFLVLAGALLTKDKLSAALLFWLGMAFIGLFLIVELDINEIRKLFYDEPKPANENNIESGALFGLLLALSAALLYTATTLITKKVGQIPSTFVALVQVVVGIGMLFPFVDFNRLPEQTSQWIDLLILGAVLTGFMYIIMYDSFQKLPTSLIALLSFIYPVTALFVDYFAFSTQISLLQVVGVIFILLAVSAVKFNWSFSSMRKTKAVSK